MTTHKLRLLIDSLYKKSSDGKIKWETTPDENTFAANFPDQTILISGGRLNNLSIANTSGTVISSVNYSDLAEFDAQVARQLPLLFNLARDSAFGVDKVIDNLLNELSKNSN